MTTVSTDLSESIAETIAGIYLRDSTDDAVAVVHGYGVKVRVHHGQLELSDGAGRHRRERRYGRADRTLQRVVITSPDGYITIEAVQWCAEHGISITLVNPDGELAGQYATGPRIPDPGLLRVQVMHADVKAVPVTRALIGRKITGHGDMLLKYLSDADSAARLYHHAALCEHAGSLAELNDIERFAAKDYWDAWSGRVELSWHPVSRERIPANWTVPFAKRKLSASRQNTRRHAIDPYNALLNYCYALAYAEARTACIAVGLNPVLGFNHRDHAGRDALVLDVMEAVRPEADACVLQLIASRTFTHRDFHEPRGPEYLPGTVRLCAPLTHELIEASHGWRRTALESARMVVSILGSTEHHTTSVKSLALSEQKRTFIAADVNVAQIMPDDVWERFRAILPDKSSQDYSSISNRTVIAALVYLEAHHQPLAYVPDGFGISRRTLHERRLRWTRTGYWADIESAIKDRATAIMQ